MTLGIIETPTITPCHCGGKASYTAEQVSCVRCGRSVKAASEFVIKPESAMRDHLFLVGVFAWNEQMGGEL
jgi:hypothetical protein